jgi:cytoskeletal protein RodZ
LGLGIHEIALKTKINYKILVNIEKERFSKLPDAGHLRYYLTSYAKALFLDPQNVADEYMKRFRQWKRSKGEL